MSETEGKAASSTSHQAKRTRQGPREGGLETELTPETGIV